MNKHLHSTGCSIKVGQMFAFGKNVQKIFEQMFASLEQFVLKYKHQMTLCNGTPCTSQGIGWNFYPRDSFQCALIDLESNHLFQVSLIFKNSTTSKYCEVHVDCNKILL